MVETCTLYYFDDSLDALSALPPVLPIFSMMFLIPGCGTALESGEVNMNAWLQQLQDYVQWLHPCYLSC